MNLEQLLLTLKGSFTSGNWGHQGRPGKYGGSSTGGGHAKIGIKPEDKKADKNLKVHFTRVDRIPDKKQSEPKKEPEKSQKPKRKYERVTNEEMLDHYEGIDKTCKSLGCKSLVSYSRDSDPYNMHLRFGDKVSKKVKEDINHLDKLIEDSPRVPKDIVVHRNVSNGFFNSGVFEKGLEFQDKGFVSTTITKGAMGGENLQIRIPKGAKGIYVEGLTKYDGEHELLLPRNAKFRVLEKDYSKAILELIIDE